MKNLHLIATDKPSVIILRQDRKLFFTGYGGQLGKIHGLRKDVPQHIYITSDEQLKHNDYYTTDGKEIYYCNTLNPTRNNHYKKVILTTDQDLIGVQAIDDEFLEWFVKNPSCEEVEVMTDAFTVKEMSMLPIGTGNFKYKIIIPKEELKQETLEEAAENNYPEGDVWTVEQAVVRRLAFMNGANWEAKKSYSEEEVLSIIDKAFHMYASSHRHDAKEWFEQFKKK